MDTRRATASARAAQLRIEEVLTCLRPDREPPPDEPPDREPPPDRDPPPVDDGRDPPPPPPPPPDSGTPVQRVDPVTPRAVMLEYAPGKVRRLSDGKEWSGTDCLDAAWKESRPARGSLVVGLRGDVGKLGLGGKAADHIGFAADVIFVGLTEDAVIGPVEHGSEWPVERFELHKAGIKGQENSFIWQQGGYLGDVVLHDWWMLPWKPGVKHMSGLHWHMGVRSFTCSRYQARALQVYEHKLYRKGMGTSQILDCDMRGGGRSFDHCRPHGEGWSPYHFGGTPPTTGSCLYEGNVSDGFGWDQETIGGGAVISNWMSLEYPIVIKGNRITHCRTGGVMIGQGAKNTNPYLTRDGYSHADVWLEDNHIECDGTGSPDARYAVSISSTRMTRFQGTNHFRSKERADLVLDDSWSAGQGAIPNGKVYFLGRDSIPDAVEIQHWVPSLGIYQAIPPETLSRMVAPEPTT